MASNFGPYVLHDRTIVFDHHPDSNGRRGVVAINVKHWTPITPLAPRAERRRVALPEKIRDALERQAEESTRDNWWGWARELAEEMDLERVSSAGRNNGWLVLDTLDRDTLSELYQTATPFCGACSKPALSHAADGKCLFEPTTCDISEYDLDAARAAHAHLVKIADYLDRIKASLTTVGQNYLDELTYQVNETWAERREEAAAAKAERLRLRREKQELRLARAIGRARMPAAREQALAALLSFYDPRPRPT